MTKKEIIQKLNEVLQKTEETIVKEMLDDLIETIGDSGKTEKRKTAVKIATSVRSKNAKEKILNAINLLRMENKEITAYRVSKTSGVHYRTVKKYLQANDQQANDQQANDQQANDQQANDQQANDQQNV